MAVMVMLLLLLFIDPGISQLSVNENIGNTPIRSFCGVNDAATLSSFINNRNSTLAQIRTQLSRNGVFYVRAQSLDDSDPVYGDAQCRRYLSAAQCVACFDSGVSELLPCTTVNADYVFSDNCFVRYENYPDYYNNPYVAADQVTLLPLQICGNQSASVTSSYSQDVDRLLSDLRVATPKAPNWYVAISREISSENSTVYAIAQCVENTSQAICQNCLNTAYSNLYNCLPNREGRFVDTGCFARYSDSPIFKDNQTIEITNFLKGHSRKVPIVAGSLGGVVFFFLVLANVLFYCRWKKFKKNKEGEDAPELKWAVNYNYKLLQLATNNFSEENSIGRGGFGEVFKAIDDDNLVMAVKKLEVSDAKAKEEFENEVLLICQIHHRNLLRLLGWSSQGSNLLLVLEYMPNGSLDNFLWGSKRGSLNWKQRFDIILGIARGLAHLHNECHVKIIHRDIKPTNILLDDHFQPKIADFGLAKFQPEDQSHVVTTFAGTLGYAAPEYARHGHLSDKVDTFSLGIVILEIISCRRCTDVHFDGPSTDYLIEHAWKLYENKEHMRLVDETLDAKQYEEEHVMKIIEIALLCTQSPASNRPTMSEVVLMLQDGQPLGERQLIRPTYIDHNRRIHINSSKNLIATGILSQKPIGLQANEQLHIEKPDDLLDELEKERNVANIC